MVGGKAAFRVAVAVTLAFGGWFACSSADHALPGDDKAPGVATVRQALEPLAPDHLSAQLTAWYVASSAQGYMSVDGSGNVIQWNDVSNHGNHVAQNDHPQARPHFDQDGWSQPLH